MIFKRLVHARAEFKQKLKQVRKEYQQEVQLKQQQQQQEQEKLLLEQEKEREERMKQIKEWKRENIAKMNYVDVYAVDPVKTPVDHVLSSGTQNNIKTQKTKKTEEKRIRYLEHAEQQSKLKLEAFLHLYHSSANFITYDNLDEKVEQCVRQSAVPVVDNMHALLTSATEQDKTQDGSARNAALKDILFGTHKGHPGVDMINDSAASQDLAQEELKKYEDLMFGKKPESD
ncbi:hypothetical protein EDD86DRAFT_199700 [Gorgonomyces haynaldii]|nr:hypothetical protein EDD86DRAFT_199700 [Gorgonomyces haynaldii]